MNDTFIHKFGGWREAEARRWRNIDGTPGGIVAVNAAVDASIRLPEGVEVWPEAKIIGSRTSIGSRASIGYGASIGSRASIGYGASIGDGASIGYGASIGSRASIGYGASIGSRASIGDGASIGYGASIGDGASIEADDWLFVAGPQGSRNAWATAVYSKKDNLLRWWIGCQHGLTTEAFRERLAREHSVESNHRADYEHLILMVETHPGLARAKT
jgi:UDP-3-O-[3-hydroxymyristoyl] glucosamine N-acyltransferase